MKHKTHNTQHTTCFMVYASCFMFFLAGTALAAYNLLQPLPGVGQSVSTFPDYITKIIPFILGLAAVLAVVEIVIGGIEYAVTEAIDSKADAIDRIRQAIFGLLLALASWLILSTINPALVNLQLNIPGLPSSSTGSGGSGKQTGESCATASNECAVGLWCPPPVDNPNPNYPTPNKCTPLSDLTKEKKQLNEPCESHIECGVGLWCPSDDKKCIPTGTVITPPAVKIDENTKKKYNRFIK